VQRLLQDTADKVEDSKAAYQSENGYSSPSTGNATHGFGRVNAFEAVRVVAAAPSGKGGVDVFLRDNRLDWGNTDQRSNTLFGPTRGYIPHWRSMDIKVDSPFNGYQAPPTASSFDSFADETPDTTQGSINRVYVRVRNRGPITAETVDVKLYWAQSGTALPPLPSDFWSVFPADSEDTTRWHPLKCTTPNTPTTVCRISNLEYSGATAAGTVNDKGQVVRFEFPAPTFTSGLANHFCLVAMVDSPQDRISNASRTTNVVDDITPSDNNVTHRNYANLSFSSTAQASASFLVRNPFKRPIKTYLWRSAPEGWKVSAVPFEFGKHFDLKAGEEVQITLSIDATLASEESGEIVVMQVLADEKRTLGGLTLASPSGAKRKSPSR
jgi:hypothetical protein